MTKKEQFIYSPETMSFQDYLEIALKEAQRGKFIPFYLCEDAAKFASKCFSISSQSFQWEKCYRLRVKRLAFVWHVWKYKSIKIS